MLDSLEALALEELSSAELRAVLARLGERELGGSDAYTVGAVAEATGFAAEEVGAVLASLRGAEFQARFAEVLSQHEARLARLEAGKHPMSNAEIKDYSHDAENFRLDPGAGKAVPHFAVVLAVLIAVAVVVFFVMGR